MRWRDWEVSVTVPASVRDRLGRSRRRTLDEGGLRFVDPPPQPSLRTRDISRATDFIKTASDKGAEHARSQGWTDDDDLTQLITSVSWYHTIELPGGVVTPGQFDHRPLLPRYGLPSDLTGKRALDVATFDGFWAFEMERRGADVTAIDIDDPRHLDFPTLARPTVDAIETLPPIGQGFEIAHRALQSKVVRRSSNVYHLDPADIGKFDFVHCGDLLLHLRDPLTALERIRSVTSGTFLLCDVVDIDTPRGSLGANLQYLGGWDDVVWWIPSLDALCQMVADAGFRDVKVQAVYTLAKTYEGVGFWRASISATG